MYRIRTYQLKTMKAIEKKYPFINSYKTAYLFSFIWLLFSFQTSLLGECLRLRSKCVYEIQVC